MSEAKHTPGPWEWVPGKHSFQGSIEPDICDFGDDTTYYPTEGAPPNLANARLIAAAPDLFPAHAGMNRAAIAACASAWPVPRPRGDEPGEVLTARRSTVCSPPTRG